jgi:hypothetical protein
MEVSVQHHAPSALPPEKDQMELLNKRLGGPQRRFEFFGEEKVFLCRDMNRISPVRSLEAIPTVTTE